MEQPEDVVTAPNVLHGSSMSIEPNRSGTSDEARECDYGPLLSPYYDGELPADRHRAVAEHVRACPACAAELADLGRLSGAFASARLPSLPPERLQHLRPRPPHPGRDAGGAAGHVRLVRWVTAVAVALFLFAAGRLAYDHAYRPPAPNPIGVPPAETAVEPHPVTPQTAPAATRTSDGTDAGVEYPPPGGKPRPPLPE